MRSYRALEIVLLLWVALFVPFWILTSIIVFSCYYFLDKAVDHSSNIKDLTEQLSFVQKSLQSCEAKVIDLQRDSNVFQKTLLSAKQDV